MKRLLIAIIACYHGGVHVVSPGMAHADPRLAIEILKPPVELRVAVQSQKARR